jgi:hypothetical protein
MRNALLGVAVATTALFIGCFRFSEEPMRTITEDAGPDTTVADTAPEAAADTGPTMCDRYGGRAVADNAMAALVTKLKADCRVDRYFLSMTADRLTHMQECMATQLAWIMRCPGVKLPATDSKGAECKDIHQSHKGLGIHNEDFDAMLDDILATLTDAKLSPADLTAIADALRIQRTDVVNPGDAGRGDACIIDTGSAADTGVDTGEEY